MASMPVAALEAVLLTIVVLLVVCAPHIILQSLIRDEMEKARLLADGR